uniref:Allatotropin-1 n=1 Tax=Charonia tritonis TaxID=1960912 RepID=A0A1S6JPZ5_9CAEN|nr:Allatotropin-1 precursor [Charonia tritonis]
MMRTSLVLLALLVIALGHALPTKNLSRQKRGFRVNSASRVAHGYGKRQFNTWDDNPLKSQSSSELMTVSELAQLAAENPSLTEALIEKFIDVDGDGIVSSQELFGLDAQ